MAEEAKPQAVADLPAPAELLPERPVNVAPQPNAKSAEGAIGATVNGDGVKAEETATDAPAQDPSNTNEKPSISEDVTQSESGGPKVDMEENEQVESDPGDGNTSTVVDQSADLATGTPASVGKAKARRKSSGVPEHKGKKLNRKNSKVKLNHSDAQPGDYFYVRLKGYPLWPGIVCDETMLPITLIKSRPVTAARADGTYREDYEDGGPKVKDRTFPVMYLHTNEFGWIPNYDLLPIDFDDVANVTDKMRKDLAAARQLAAEKHPLSYFKDILKNFMAQKAADLAAKEAAKAEKKAAKSAKKEKKSSKTVDADEDGDVDMADAPAEDDVEGDATPATKSTPSGKKRPAVETLPGKESKKIKLKLTSTPKATNGTAATPKSTKEKSEKSATKSAKPKAKKASAKEVESPEIVVPKEPELTAEEKRVKKEKEILFLRHKLQKGLLTKDQEPKEDEMSGMNEYVGKLEGYADLEVSIIRATKINKVLKAIIKLPFIPKEDEYKFKARSQTLLDKWNKLLASETSTPSAAAPTTNGNASEAKADGFEANESPAEGANGTKESSIEKAEDKAEDVKPTVLEVQETIKEPDTASGAVVEAAKETIAEPTPEAPAA